MASRELYLKNANATERSRLYYRDNSNNELFIPGVLTTAPSEISREIYIRVISGTRYLYWSHGAGQTYRCALTNDGATSEPTRSFWLSGAVLYIADSSVRYRYVDSGGGGGTSGTGYAASGNNLITITNTNGGCSESSQPCGAGFSPQVSDLESSNCDFGYGGLWYANGACVENVVSCAECGGPSEQFCYLSDFVCF